MWRTLFPAFALGAAILAGLVLLYLFLSDAVGTATMLVTAFAFAALGITALVLHWPSDDVVDERTDMRL